MKRIILLACLLCTTTHAQRFIKQFATVGEMLAANPTDIHTNCLVAGYWTAGDGGGGLYYYSKAATTTTNRGSVLKATGYAGRYVGIFDGVYNVRRFGAKGDGSAADVGPIQDALNMGGTVQVPEGTYMIDAGYQLGTRVGLFITNNTHLMLDNGAELRVVPNALTLYDLIRITNASNVSITGGKFTGDFGSHTGVPTEFGYGVQIMGSTNVVIDGVELSYFEGDAVIARDGTANVISDTITIKNCNVHHNRRNGLSFVGAANVKVINNTIGYTGGTSPESGIDIEPGSNTTNINYIIQGNTLNNNTRYGLLTGLYPGATNSYIYGLHVVDNVILNNQVAGTWIVENADPAVPWVSSSFSGNTISSNNGHGLYISGLSNPSVVSGNNLVNNGWQGFNLTSVTNVLIGGNTLNGNGVRAGGGSISAYIDGVSNLITGNIIHKGLGPTYPYYGISIHGTNNVMAHNAVYDAGSGTSILDSSVGLSLNEGALRGNLDTDINIQKWYVTSPSLHNSAYVSVAKAANESQLWINDYTNLTYGTEYGTVIRNNYTGSSESYGSLSFVQKTNEVFRLHGGGNRGKVSILMGGLDVQSVNDAQLFGAKITQGNRTVTSSNFFYFGPLSYNTGTAEYWRMGYYDGTNYDSQITYTTNGYLGVRKTLPTEAIETSGNIKGAALKGTSVNISNTVVGTVEILVNNSDNTAGSTSEVKARGAYGQDAGFKLLSGTSVVGIGGPRDLVLFNNSTDASAGKAVISLHDGTAQHVTAVFEKNGDFRPAGGIFSSNLYVTNSLTVAGASTFLNAASVQASGSVAADTVVATNGYTLGANQAWYQPTNSSLTTIATLPTGVEAIGSRIYYGPTGPLWGNARNVVDLYDEFSGGNAAGGSALGWYAATAGGGDAATFSAGQAGSEAGNGSVSFGTADGGYGALRLGSTGFSVGRGYLYMETRIRFQQIPSDTYTYSFTYGLQDKTSSSNNTDGVFFRVCNATNSGGYGNVTWVGGVPTPVGWEAWTCKGGASNWVGTATVPSNSTWYRLGIEMPADASWVKYYIDGTAVATNSTAASIPTTESSCGPMYHSISHGVLTAKATYVDYFRLFQQNTTTR